jgi:hypothetical protein
MVVCLGLADGQLKRDTLLEQLRDWFYDLTHFVNPFVNIDGW